MYGWRPLKFRIEAFVNGFIDLVSCLFWLAELIFFWLRLTDGCFFLGFASTNHLLLLEPFARSLPVNFGFPLPSLPHRRFLAILVHPIAHPIELVADWIDGSIFDSLRNCALSIHHSLSATRIFTPIQRLPSFGQPCTPPVVLIYLRTSPSSIWGLWTCDLLATTHPPACPRTDPRLHPLLPRHPPTAQPTNIKR